MKVRFLGSTEVYEMRISTPFPGLVQLHPPFPEAEPTSGFEILTEKGTVYGKYPNHKTIYRKLDDGSIILSGEGSIWSPPPEPKPIPEPEPIPKPTLEERKEEKKSEIGSICEQAIYRGINVELPSGWEHFSLSEKDQINLFGKQAQMADGAERLEYHQDGHPCRYYTAEEMQIIIKAAMEHVSYHTTYCNALNMWIAGVEDEQELESIFYGADIPEKYQSEVLKDYLKKIMESAPEEEEMDKGLVPEEEEANNEESVPEEGEPAAEEGEPEIDEIDSDREEVKESETIS